MANLWLLSRSFVSAILWMQGDQRWEPRGGDSNVRETKEWLSAILYIPVYVFIFSSNSFFIDGSQKLKVLKNYRFYVMGILSYVTLSYPTTSEYKGNTCSSVKDELFREQGKHGE